MQQYGNGQLSASAHHVPAISGVSAISVSAVALLYLANVAMANGVVMSVSISISNQYWLRHIRWPGWLPYSALRLTTGLHSSAADVTNCNALPAALAACDLAEIGIHSVTACGYFHSAASLAWRGSGISAFGGVRRRLAAPASSASRCLLQRPCSALRNASGGGASGWLWRGIRWRELSTILWYAAFS